MKDFIHILMAGITTGMIAFLGFLPSVHAETIINDGFLQGDTVWDVAHSPYVLNDVVTVPAGITLTIEPGVRVVADPASPYDPYLYVNGTLDVAGSPSAHVSIGSLFGITVDHGYATLSYTDTSMKGTLSFIGATGSIASSTIDHDAADTSDGVYIQDSSVRISGSRIAHHVNGVVVQGGGGVFQAIGQTHLAWNNDGGDADIVSGLIAQTPVVSMSVQITDSSLVDNVHTAITNYSSATVDADHNWWGSQSGPSDAEAAASNGVKGYISYTPWLDHDPTVPQVASLCCSSILFIPGLEASRLYRSEVGMFGIGSTTNRLWEPNRNDDVRKLFLNTNGSSTDASIYVGGPIGRALGVVSIYGSFMDMLDTLVTQGTMNEWRPFGYDWRAAIGDVVTGPTRRATTTEQLIDTVISMADHSKTGKVTIVAHSNGGLVAKYLVKTLVDMGKVDIIDSVISVAVPYLGTPQAILGLLHGDNQSILGGLILKQSVAKEWGVNMPSAYSLLPSATYFARALGPTIAYASTTGGEGIDTSTEQNSFISSRANGWLMTTAEALHAILDPFVWPSTIVRWAIVGWGNRTAKGIVYSADGYRATTTPMGDSTVVVPSAVYDAGTVAAINLPQESVTEGRVYDHANILESSATQSAIRDMVTGADTDQSVRTLSITDKLRQIPNLTIGEPDYEHEKTFLVVSTHSPVELHLSDMNGRHTGFAPIPASTDEELEDGLWKYAEHDIPGSSFETHGDEEQPETYITIPDEGARTFAVSIQGIGVGEFTYRVERIRGGEVVDSVQYGGIPVTPLTNATTTIVTNSVAEQPEKLASSTRPLSVDLDGNGSADMSIKPNTVVRERDQVHWLKLCVQDILGSSKRAKDVIRRLERLEMVAEKGKLKRLDRRVDALKKRIVHMNKKTLSEEQKRQLIELVEAFVTQLE